MTQRVHWHFRNDMTQGMTSRAALAAAMLALLVAVAEASRLANLRSIHTRSEDNSISPDRKTGYRKRDWLKISQAPPNVVNTQLGGRVELECEVIGSPAPSIQWVRGSNPQQQAEVYESNRIVLEDASGLSKIKSRLILDCVMPQHEGLYTCVAVAGGRLTVAQPSMVLIQGSHVNNLTALLSACHGDTPQTSRVARVSLWSPVTMQNIGSDVTLPCRVTGHPAPASYWLDDDNQLLGDTDPRFKVLPEGDLLIVKLRWTDMGGYKCVASNRAGSDNVESFVYPLLQDDS